MAAALTASFILKLEDQLSNGIVALGKKLEALAKLGKQVKLDGLDTADRVLDRVGGAAERASRKVVGIGAAARAAAADLRRLASQPIVVNSAGTAFLPPAAARAAMAATILAAAAASGGGGLRVPPSAPFAGPAASPLLLGAPSGPGGIPISGVSPFVSGLAAMGPAAAAARAQMAQLGAQVQSVGKHTRELGEAGLLAFGTGFGLGHVIGEYAKYENTLRHIAITQNVAIGDIPGVVAAAGKQFDALALKSGQSSEKIAESANFLITTGIGRGAVDRLLPIIAQAATAYNVDIGDSSQGVFTLGHNLKVADSDLPGTISALALAGKEGHFSFGDFSRFLPEVAPIASQSGLSGAAGAREIAASLEVSRANAGTSGEAATNYRDFLSHLFGAPKRGLGHEFKRYGVDLQKVLLGAEKHGVSAPQAVLEEVRKLTKGKTDFQKNLIIGGLFHNQQSAQYVRGALGDYEHLQELIKLLKHADSGTIAADFNKAADAPLVKMRLMQEKLVQIERRLGQGFSPLLGVLNTVLDKVLATVQAIDEAHPGAIDAVLSWVGGFLALGAALGLLIPLFKLIGSGFGLLFTAGRALIGLAALIGAPFGIAGGVVLGVIVAIAAAAYLLYEHWDQVKDFFRELWAAVVRAFEWARAAVVEAWQGVSRFFSNLWIGLQDSFGQFVAWLNGWVSGSVTAVVQAFKDAWSGIVGFFAGLWGQAVAPFERAIAAIEARIGALRAALGLGGAPAGPANPNGPATGSTNPGSSFPPGFQPSAYHPGAGGTLDVRIRVDQGGRVTGVDATSSDGRVRPQLNRGDVARRT